jgi:hypothetical protein
MEILIDAESVSTALEVRWTVAHMGETESDRIHRWGSVADVITGVWLAINYSDAISSREKIALLDDLEILRAIANQHVTSELEVLSA